VTDKIVTNISGGHWRGMKKVHMTRYYPRTRPHSVTNQKIKQNQTVYI